MSGGLTLACSRCGQIFPDLDKLLGHACPKAAPPPPVYSVPPLVGGTPSKTAEAVRKAAQGYMDIPLAERPRRKPNRSKAEVAADKAAKQLQREAKSAARLIESADDYTPAPLPSSGAAPISGPVPVDNPSHPVRNPIRAARWRSVSTMPHKPTTYCICGMALPLRPGSKCENCGRAISNPMQADRPHARRGPDAT